MNLLASSPAAMFLTVFRRCLSACHRQSVGRHPDADGATAAPFRLFLVLFSFLPYNECATILK